MCVYYLGSIGLYIKKINVLAGNIKLSSSVNIALFLLFPFIFLKSDSLDSIHHASVFYQYERVKTERV